ncbi:MAG: DUF2070 family protein [Pyrobaculum sp.]
MRNFERGYSLIFGKSPKKVAGLATFLLGVAAVLTGAPLCYIAFGAALFVALYVVDRSVVNPRRSYYVAAISTLLVAFFDLVFRKPPLTFALIGAVVTAIVVQTLKCRSPAFLLPLAAAALFYHLMGHLYLAAASFFYAVVIYGLRPVVNKMAGGLDAMCIFSSFLYAVFAENDLMEDAFRQLGGVERVPLHIYLLGGRHVVLVSDFHPGPFRHIGGGMLVDRLNKEVEGMGYRFTFIHGVGSHERDPISKRSVSEIIRAVRSALSSMPPGAPPRGVMPTEVVAGDVKAVGMSLGVEPHLAVVGRVKSASDDIPLWVAQRVDPGVYIMADAQNKFDGVVKWDERDVASLAEVLKRLHEAPLCGKYLVGVGKSDAASLDPLGHEIGPAGISAIVVQCDDRRGLLVVLDGNNLHSGLYDKIVATYRRRGYDVVEIVTTDTHRATGVGFGRGYRIVGERIEHSRILEVVEKAVGSAERELGQLLVAYRRVEIEAEVLGEEGFRKLQYAAEMYRRIGLVVISAIFVMPIAIIALLA